MKIKFSLRFLLFVPLIVIVILFFAKAYSRSQQSGWDQGGLLSKFDERPSVFFGSLGGTTSELPHFGYIIVDSDDCPTNYPTKELVSSDWGKFFSGRRVPRSDDAFYLAYYKDDKLLFFDKVDDEWIQYKFSRGSGLIMNDVDSITTQLNILAPR